MSDSEKVPKLESLRASIIHGLRMQGWSKSDAEAEAAARLLRYDEHTRLAIKENRQ